jgi:hypothetical protein
MTNVSTRPHPGAILPGATALAAKTQIAPALAAATIEFDTSAIDTITSRTLEIQALASCATCLSAVAAAGEVHAGYLLTDSALPLLNDVIRRLADEAAQAGNQLWEQFQQARAAANGKGCAA